MLEHLARALETQGEYRLRAPAFPPVVGAALYAAKISGRPLDESAMARLRDARVTP